MPGTHAKCSLTATETAGPEPATTKVDLAPAKKKRGQPPKNPITAAPTATGTTTSDGATSAVAPKKALKKAAKQPNPSDATIESSNSGDDTPITKDQLLPAKWPRAQKPAPTLSCDPLPSYAPNDHPGTLDVPCPKHLSTKVKAARKELEAIEAHKA